MTDVQVHRKYKTNQVDTVLVSDNPLLVLRFKIKLAGVQLPSDRNSSRTYPPTSNNPLLFPREKSLGAESNTVQKFSRIYIFAQIKEEGRGMWEQTKNLTGPNTGQEREAFEKGRNEPAIAGIRKMERKESLKKWGDHARSMREMERDGEKLVVTRTTHCADCKWRVQDQSFPPLIHRAIVLHCLLAFPQHEYITRHSDVAYCLWITGLPDNKGYFHKKTLIHFSSYLIRGRRKEALRS